MGRKGRAQDTGRLSTTCTSWPRGRSNTKPPSFEEAKMVLAGQTIQRGGGDDEAPKPQAQGPGRRASVPTAGGKSQGGIGARAATRRLTESYCAGPPRTTNLGTGRREAPCSLGAISHYAPGGIRYMSSIAHSKGPDPAEDR